MSKMADFAWKRKNRRQLAAKFFLSGFIIGWIVTLILCGLMEG